MVDLDLFASLGILTFYCIVGIVIPYLVIKFSVDLMVQVITKLFDKQQQRKLKKYHDETAQ